MTQLLANKNNNNFVAKNIFCWKISFFFSGKFAQKKICDFYSLTSYLNMQLSFAFNSYQRRKLFISLFLSLFFLLSFSSSTPPLAT